MSLKIRIAAIVPQLSLVAFAAATALALLSAPAAHAQSYNYPASCYYCKNVGFLTSDCTVPPNNGNGTGIYCSISWVNFNVLCYTSGGACNYTCFGCDGGGGTGGGGGGGSDSCEGGAYCPPQCFDCGGQYY